MNKCVDFAELQRVLKPFEESSAYTNQYMLPDELQEHISKGNLHYLKDGNYLLLLVDRGKFFRAYYYLKSLEYTFPINLDKPVVQELLYRGSRKFPQDEVQFWNKCGFENYIGRDCYFLKPTDEPQSLFKEESYVTVDYLSKEGYLLDARNMIIDYLDTYTGDMLSYDDLRNYAMRSELYGVFIHDKLAGILQAELKNKVFWLGHMVVKSEFRGLGLSKVLLKKYLQDGMQRNCRQFQLWVINDNKPAVALYKNHGFKYLNKSTLSLLKK